MQRLLLCLLLVASGTAVAADSAYQIDLGPFVGGGSLSTGAKVRNTSGYSIALERDWPLTDSGLALGPRAELADAFLSARAVNGPETDTVTYDNRIFAAGLTLSQTFGETGTEAQRFYLTAVAGRAYTKLAVDASTDKTYRQTLYDNIYGNYFASELGATVSLKGNFGLGVAVLASLYRAQQADATYSREGNGLDAQGNEYALAESGAKGQSDLPGNVDMRMIAVKLGLTLGF